MAHNGSKGPTAPASNPTAPKKSEHQKEAHPYPTPPAPATAPGKVSPSHGESTKKGNLGGPHK